MSVCRHWRAIITSYPIFWCNIWLRPSPKFAAAAATLQFILAHSKTVPLTILVEVFFPDMGHASKTIHILAPYSHRWADITVTFPPKTCSRLDESLVKGSVPQLRRLSLKPVIDTQTMSYFEFAPNLQALEISSYFLHNLRLP
ncbi:hypothetical protein C8J56DRAFT_1165977 [Mycena floridula]|nr:hypothetical protein C8J56DRAFT_1165977 [Mycena floridula]